MDKKHWPDWVHMPHYLYEAITEDDFSFLFCVFPRFWPFSVIGREWGGNAAAVKEGNN